jgi:lipopolysaccharide export system ATP-binding protein
MAGEKIIFSMEGVTKTFPPQKQVLKNIWLSFFYGAKIGVLGLNGSGKSTLLKLIAGLDQNYQGKIQFDGTYKIGYLAQESSIFRGLTVEENIRAVLELTEGSRQQREEKLRELLDEFSITHLRNSPAVALSGGERRRVEIARALAADPEFMLLDEPFAGIDPIAISDIRKLVRQLTSRGIGVLVTDHNVRETLELIDTALIIHEGQVLTQGTPGEIVANPDVRRHYLGADFSL